MPSILQSCFHLNGVSRSAYHPDVDEGIHCVTQSLVYGHPPEKCDLLEEQETGTSQHETYFYLKDTVNQVNFSQCFHRVFNLCIGLCSIHFHVY